MPLTIAYMPDPSVRFSELEIGDVFVFYGMVYIKTDEGATALTAKPHHFHGFYDSNKVIPCPNAVLNLEPKK